MKTTTKIPASITYPCDMRIALNMNARKGETFATVKVGTGRSAGYHTEGPDGRGRSYDRSGMIFHVEALATIGASEFLMTRNAAEANKPANGVIRGLND